MNLNFRTLNLALHLIPSIKTHYNLTNNLLDLLKQVIRLSKLLDLMT